MGRLNVDHLLHKLTSAHFSLARPYLVVIKHILVEWRGETVCLDRHAGACLVEIKLAAFPTTIGCCEPFRKFISRWVEDHRRFVQHFPSRNEFHSAQRRRRRRLCRSRDIFICLRRLRFAGA